MTALDRVTFTVEAGEVFGFVGSNGAGKTTTMRAILGVLRQDGGEIFVGDAPITAESRRHIGYMPEERGLYPKMRVGEQLVYLARLHGIPGPEAVSLMEQWTQKLGIETRRRDVVDALSLGNQQRVQLAAALMHRPRLLVLDEPFSGLDPLAVDVMSSVLREIAATGVPVLFSSHQLQLVDDISDRIGIIKAGAMVAVGTVEELSRSGGERYRLVASGLDDAWLRARTGVDAQPVGEGEYRVSFDGVEPERFLAEAVAHGTVQEFSRLRIALSELYKEVIAQ